MDRIAKKIEVGADVAIIAVAALLSVVIVKNYLLVQSQSIANNVEFGNELTKAKMSLSEVDWGKNGQTLILALSTKCHFCSESGSFYRQLAKSHGETHLIAVLPQPVDEGKRYLESLGVVVDEIKQSPLSAINVRGTPTLLLVNRDGTVISNWVGKLPEAQELEILSKVLNQP